MSAIVEILRERLSHVRDAASDREKLTTRWVDDPFPLSPWETWTLLTLVRHRDRQQFVADTIVYRLNAELDALAARGSMGHPDGPQQGVVPGLTDWEYYFHGRGCRLTHRVSGEAIDVDFYDVTADWFDEFFFINYLESLTEPSFAERRVIALHASFRTVVLALEELLRVGLLDKHEDRPVVRLAFDHQELLSLLDDVEHVWHDESIQQLVAAAIGDWLMLENMPLAGSAKQIVETRAETLRQQRSGRLVSIFQSEDGRAEALEALNDLGSSARDDLLTVALAGPPSGRTSVALGIIGQCGDEKWCDQVETLMNRTDPNGDLPAPHVWLMCFKFLLRHGRVSDIRRKLEGVRSHCLAEAAVVSLEHFPELAIDLFRRALRSKIPYNRIRAAATLAIIDQPWSRAELALVLRESDDQMMTTECRSALLETHSVDSQQLVVDWETRNPHEPAPSEWITFEEMHLRQSDESIRYEMAQLHDKVMPLRKIIAPAP